MKQTDSSASFIDKVIITIVAVVTTTTKWHACLEVARVQAEEADRLLPQLY